MGIQIVATATPARPVRHAPETLFATRGWLADAPAGFRAEILAMARPITVPRGQWVFAIDDPPGGIYGIISGGIGIEGAADWHPVRLGHILRAGAWFGHHPVLTGGGRRVQGMRATEDSDLLHVPLPGLRALVARDALAARHVGAMADAGSILGTRIISDLLIPQAPRRIAAVLLRVTGAEDGVEPTHPDGFLLTQGDLGEMANASRPHVNRVLAHFAERGWITKSYQHIRVLDVPALQAFAAADAREE
jgi:CRP-like cAMP-binding protein